jgi:chromosome segregation ATPase
MRNLLSHTYYLKKKFKSSQPKGGEKQIDITALSSNLGEEDMQIQVESLKNINEFLKNKLFESEKIIKVYKNDIDFLKGQSKVQEEMTSTLKETLEQSREEQENIKKENILLKQKYEDLKKKYDENNKSHLNVIENLRKDNEGLKKDKTKLAAAIVQMRKITEDLRKKNTSKAEALLAIKNFFMNSTLVKLKDIEGFKEAEDNLENKNNNISDTNTNKNTDEGK